MEWIFENQTIKTADDIQTILEQYNCIEEQNAQESALTKYSVKQFNLRNKTFIEIASEAKLTTFQNSPTRKSFYLENGSKVLERKVLNNIDTTKNILLDCDILSCTWKTEITPAQTMRLKPEDISGGFQFGQATYSAPYYLKNETYNVTIAGQAIYEYSNFTDENGTARTDATIVGYEESTTEQRVRTVKDYDISSLIMEKGQTYIFYIDFQKSSPTERVDIYDTVLGVENKELAWWNDSWEYRVPVIINTTVTPSYSNYTARFSINSSNTTLWNTTTCTNIRVLNNFNNQTLDYEIESNHSMVCGNATNLLQIFVKLPTSYNLTALNETHNNTVWVYLGNTNAPSGENKTGTWAGTPYYLVYHMAEGSGTVAIDSTGRKNMTYAYNTSAPTEPVFKIASHGGIGIAANESVRAYGRATGVGYSNAISSVRVDAWVQQGTGTLVSGGGIANFGEQQNYRFLGYYPCNASSMCSALASSETYASQFYHPLYTSSSESAKFSMFRTTTTGYSWKNGKLINTTAMSAGFGNINDSFAICGTDSVRSENPWSAPYIGVCDEIRVAFNTNYDETFIGSIANQTWSVGDIESLYPFPIAPSILNSTNGTYFTVSNDLYGWIANRLDGLSNVSYTWWNGSTAYSSGTAINVTGNSTGISHNIANISASLLNAGDVWILQINGTNGTTNVSDTNSSSITITNTAPIFTNVSFTANGSSYQLGPVQLNFSAQDLDSGNLTYFVNWFLNGTNISAYAQTGSMLSGTTVRVTPPVSVYNVSDNWYARVWVTDGSDTTPYNNTHNTTIQNYFSSVVAYAPNATSHIYTQAYINFTVNGAQNASARFTLGTQNVSMTNSGTGNNYEFYNTTIVPPAVSEPTNYEGVWYYRAILANGSYYELTTNQSVNVGTNGFFICNATINTTAIEYTMLDSFTLLPVNASVSLLTEWLGDDGSTITKSLTDTNETVYICVTPSTFNRQATISESISATGYLPAVTFRDSQNYSSDVTQRTIYLTNSSSGSVYTFQTLNQFGGPVSGATVKIMQGSTTIFIGITDETGSALAPLTELNIYQVIASATGYSNSSFNFIAGATTTIPITLVSTSASNITAPNYQEVFNEVQFTIAPTTRFFSSPTTITYTISSPNSTLGSWGFFITSNGTVVNTQTSTTTTGGSLYYTVNQTGTYILNIWFKADGFANYTPPSYFFTYGNTSGVSTASENLQTGSIISGFGFYLLAVIFAMMGALWISQYSPEGAAIVGLLILCAFTFMWSDAIVLQTGVDELGQPTGITSLMATGFVLLTTLSAFYLRQYGA